MVRVWNSRLGHYVVLIAAMAVLTLPNLGAHSLWDIDEGLNAEAAREMLEADRWVTPTFNFELRSAKPVLLYWCQIVSYKLFGVSEFSARLPSVLAGMLTVLLLYELGRLMFDPKTAFLSGLILASCIEFCVLSHAATPDSVLLLFTVLTFLCFWAGSRNGSRAWWIPTAIATGLAVLTKGPIGVALPGLVILSYFWWNGELDRLWDRRIFWAGTVFLAVALPWYVLVTLDTRGEFIRDFWGKHNVHRFIHPMENHRGPIFFHALGLFIFFAPWSIALVACLWYGVRAARGRDRANGDENDHRLEAADQGIRAYRLLICWFSAYLLFFSVAATKLPNYVLPLYPTLALLTARYFRRWRLRELSPPNWVIAASWVGLLMVAGVTIFGLLIAGGAFGALPFEEIPTLTGMERWAMIGVVPLAGAIVALVFYRRGHRPGVITTISLTSVVYVGLIASLPTVAMNKHKAPKALIENSGAHQPTRDIRLATLAWFQPTLVFYAEREVEKFDSWERAEDFLAQGRPAYLFVPEPIWETIHGKVTVPHREVTRQFDFLKNVNIVVVRNEVE